MPTRRHAICFVDDDPEEVRRFRANLEQYFAIGAGSSLREAVADLPGGRKPDLFVLDLYFPEGALNTQEQLERLHSARRQFLAAQARFNSVLAALGQRPQGGLGLARRVRDQYGRCACVFFTRKGTLEDAIMAQEFGALKVMKKPDPNDADIEGRSLSEAYDLAFNNNSAKIAAEIEDIIKTTSWWWKNKARVQGFVSGVAASVVAGVLLQVLGFV
jgi:DNA-binding NarL/FixJ family response regulator